MLSPPRDGVILLQDDIPRAQVCVFDILEAACKNKTSLDGVTRLSGTYGSLMVHSLFFFEIFFK